MIRPPELPNATPQLGYRRSMFRVVNGTAPKWADLLLIFGSVVSVFMALGGAAVATLFYVREDEETRDMFLINRMLGLAALGALLTFVFYRWSNHFRQKKEIDLTDEALGAMAMQRGSQSEPAVRAEQVSLEAKRPEPDQAK